MQTLKLKIGGMTCNHCVMRVKKALEGCKGAATADVDLASASAVVTGETLDSAELIKCVVAAGYTAKESENHSV
jgi:copper chaperone